MPRFLIDGDACPVKQEVLKVAERHRLPVVIVANSWHRIDHYLVSQEVVPQGADAADDRIVELAQPGDVVITADIPLAARCLDRGALAIDHRGKAFTDTGMGMQLAMRDLLKSLRDSGELEGGGGPGFTRQDRSRFLDGLERLAQQALRDHKNTA